MLSSEVWKDKIICPIAVTFKLSCSFWAFCPGLLSIIAVELWRWILIIHSQTSYRQSCIITNCWVWSSNLSKFVLFVSESVQEEKHKPSDLCVDLCQLSLFSLGRESTNKVWTISTNTAALGINADASFDANCWNNWKLDHGHCHCCTR